ncbi:MAG: hypothetical protein GY711_13535 [bacterium]|nr:hypothetical protein [bacterium]
MKRAENPLFRLLHESASMLSGEDVTPSSLERLLNERWVEPLAGVGKRRERDRSGPDLATEIERVCAQAPYTSEDEARCAAWRLAQIGLLQLERSYLRDLNPIVCAFVLAYDDPEWAFIESDAKALAAPELFPGGRLESLERMGEFMGFVCAAIFVTNGRAYLDVLREGVAVESIEQVCVAGLLRRFATYFRSSLRSRRETLLELPEFGLEASGDSAGTTSLFARYESAVDAIGRWTADGGELPDDWIPRIHVELRHLDRRYEIEALELLPRLLREMGQVQESIGFAKWFHASVRPRGATQRVLVTCLAAAAKLLGDDELGSIF